MKKKKDIQNEAGILIGLNDCHFVPQMYKLHVIQVQLAYEKSYLVLKNSDIFHLHCTVNKTFCSYC